MSNLYVRIRTGFYTHRKTARLRAVIGDDAFWIPPRLWAYAAEEQPDGNFSDYSSDEIAMLLGCHKYASSIKQALLDAGWLDADGMIHDWHEHAGYHKAYSERAKVAADKRWADERAKKEKEQKKEDSGHRTVDSGGKHTPSNACSINPAFPESLRTPEFEAAWKDWVSHRRDIRKALTPGTVREQLAALEKLGVELAITTIKRSIAGGWQGLFPPDHASGGNGGKPSEFHILRGGRWVDKRRIGPNI